MHIYYDIIAYVGYKVLRKFLWFMHEYVMYPLIFIVPIYVLIYEPWYLFIAVLYFGIKIEQVDCPLTKWIINVMRREVRHKIKINKHRRGF